MATTARSLPLHFRSSPKPTLEFLSYLSYQAYCHLLGAEALDFESWRYHSRRLFGNSTNGRPREVNASE